MTLTIPVILGSVRAGSQGIRAVRFLVRHLISLLSIPEIGKALDEAGHPADPRLDASATRFIAELTWYAEALRRQPADGTPHRSHRRTLCPVGRAWMHRP